MQDYMNDRYEFKNKISFDTQERKKIKERLKKLSMKKILKI